MNNEAFAASPKSLAISLRAESTYRLGEPVVLGVEIENRGNETLQLLQWGTPLEDQFTANYLIVERDGEVLPYDAKLVKRGDPRLDDYASVDPGEKLETTVEVSAAYPIDRPGHYKVAVKTTFNDAFTVSGKEKRAARTRKEHEPLELTAAAVSFEVLPGEEPLPTVGERVRKEQPKAKAREEKVALAEEMPPGPQFVGGTPEQQEETVTAHRNAQSKAALAAQELSSGSVNPLYATWFGAFDQERYDTVTRHYQEISNTLLSEQVTYNLTGEGCEPNVFAYTYFGSRMVWLCSAYLSAPESGTDTKFGTLIHEWSHAVCETEDEAYGQGPCKALAEANPDIAINNADSHEYFAESL